jgi:hypothetical protein
MNCLISYTGTGPSVRPDASDMAWTRTGDSDFDSAAYRARSSFNTDLRKVLCHEEMDFG